MGSRATARLRRHARLRCGAKITRLLSTPSPPRTAVSSPFGGRLLRPQAELAQRAVDPLAGDLLLHAVLAQALVETGKIDLIDRLILVEAGEHHTLLVGDRVDMALQ